MEGMEEERGGYVLVVGEERGRQAPVPGRQRASAVAWQRAPLGARDAGSSSGACHGHNSGG